MKQGGMVLLVALAALAVTSAWGDQGVVLAVRPDGVVIDVTALPTIQPGARVGFLRPDPQRTLAGQGFVLDVQAGQALVGVTPGTGVQVSDLVVLCPSRGSGDTDQVRALVEGIRAQVASSQVLATAARLQAVLDAREAAIQQGSCDMVRFEQEVQGLLAQLQGDAAAAQAPAASPSPSAAAPSPPPAYGSGGVTAGASSPPGDAIDAAARGADVLAKLAEIAQTLGLSARGAGAGGPPPGTTGAGTTVPPAGGGYPGGGLPPAGGSSYPPSGTGTGARTGTPAASGTAAAGAGTGTVGGARPTWRVTPIPSPSTRAQVAAIPKTTVTGRIQTQSGQPVAAAQILVGDTRDQSDAQGLFTVPGLPPGQYTVTVTAPGYLKQTRMITLSAGETERLVVVMPRSLPFRAAPKTP